MKKLVITTLLSLLVISIVPCMAEKCSTSDIEILEWHWERDITGGIWIIGELKNNCDYAVGVELQVIVRDENDRVIDSSEFWPASIKNILPGDIWPIKAPITDKPNAKHLSLRVIEVRAW